MLSMFVVVVSVVIDIVDPVSSRVNSGTPHHASH